jgi:ubiquinone/menaquinone biosynthesis C-methylase UbiE
MNASSTFLATDGDGYELTMGRWSRRLAVPFVEFAGGGDGERVLDVGCGTGHLAATVAAKSRPAEVHGVDMSPAYIAHARRTYPDTRLVFRVGDACALDYPDGTFDRVLAMLLLHFVPRAADAITEMRRVAKPGSVVAATVWDARGGFVSNRMFFDTAAALDPKAGERRAKNYTRPMTRPGELAAAWRSAGFDDVTERVLSIRMEYASFADYWAPCSGSEGPIAEYVKSLGGADRARLQDAVRAAYLDGEADGPRSYAALAWAVMGNVPR